MELKRKTAKNEGHETFVTRVLRNKRLNGFPLNYFKQYINNIYNIHFPTLCVEFFNVENTNCHKLFQ